VALEAGRALTALYGSVASARAYEEQVASLLPNYSKSTIRNSKMVRYFRVMFDKFNGVEIISNVINSNVIGHYNSNATL
jgi:hypothetical protein